MSDFPSTIWATIRSAGAGRATAVAQVVTQYRPAIVAYCRMRGLDAVTAEDVSQDVFLQIFEDRFLERADPARGRFRSLLFAVARNMIAHHFQREGAKKRGGGKAKIRLLGSDDPILDGVQMGATPDADFDRAWVLALVRSAVERLRVENENYHTSLNAFIVEGKSYREIAEATGKTEDMVRNYIARGREKLVKILRESIAAVSSSAEEYEDEVRFVDRLLEGRE